MGATWNDDGFLTEITFGCDHCIHTRIKVQNESKTFILSAIYASPQAGNVFHYGDNFRILQKM